MPFGLAFFAFGLARGASILVFWQRFLGFWPVNRDSRLVEICLGTRVMARIEPANSFSLSDASSGMTKFGAQTEIAPDKNLPKSRIERQDIQFSKKFISGLLFVDTDRFSDNNVVDG